MDFVDIPTPPRPWRENRRGKRSWRKSRRTFLRSRCSNALWSNDVPMPQVSVIVDALMPQGVGNIAGVVERECIAEQIADETPQAVEEIIEGASEQTANVSTDFAVTEIVKRAVVDAFLTPPIVASARCFETCFSSPCHALTRVLREGGDTPFIGWSHSVKKLMAHQSLETMCSKKSGD